MKTRKLLVQRGCNSRDVDHPCAMTIKKFTISFEEALKYVGGSEDWCEAYVKGGTIMKWNQGNWGYTYTCEAAVNGGEGFTDSRRLSEEVSTEEDCVDAGYKNIICGLNYSSVRALYTAAMLLLTPNLQGLEKFNVIPCETPLFQAPMYSGTMIWQHQPYDTWYSGWMKCRNNTEEENRVCVFAQNNNHTCNDTSTRVHISIPEETFETECQLHKTDYQQKHCCPRDVSLTPDAPFV